jgi:hypothetical protein
MTDAAPGKVAPRISVLACVAYCVLSGLICGSVAAGVPTWVLLEVTQIQNAATVDRYKTARDDRQDFNRRMDKQLSDLNASILTACKVK